MANVYTSSYTGEQVDAAVAGVNNLINGSTPAAKATADANGNNIANTYATQTGTYSGMTVGNATNAASAGNASQLGGVNAESYAQLSQVVRTDEGQSLTDTQKQQAQRNLYLSNYFGINTSENSGWRKVANIPPYTFAKLTLTFMYNNFMPVICQFDIAYGGSWDYGSSISFNGIYNPSNNTISGIRLLSNGDIEVNVTDQIIETYCNVMLQLLNKDSRDGSIYGFTGSSGQTVLNTLNLTNTGINTSGTICQNGVPVLAVDPATLSPSTANGWTQGSLSTNLSAFESGLYVVATTSVSTSVIDNYSNNPLYDFIFITKGNGRANWKYSIGYQRYYFDSSRSSISGTSNPINGSYSDITAATLWFKKIG